MAENTGLADQLFNAKQGVNPSNGPQSTDIVLDNSHVNLAGDASGNLDITAKMEVNANAEINANPEFNANVTVDSNANTPSRTEDSDRELIEQDSLESLDPLPDQEESGQDGSAPSEEKPQVQEQEQEQVQEPEAPPQPEPSDQQDREPEGQAQGGAQAEAPVDGRGESLGEELGEEDAQKLDEGELQDATFDSVDAAAPAGELEAGAFQDETLDDADEEYPEGDDEQLEELLSPAYSESKTFDIITTDREFESEDDTESKGTTDATHEDLNTTNTSDESRPRRQRKEPVIDASKLREREERSASNKRAHLQKKSDNLKDKNDQRRAAVEERKRQQDIADKQRKEAILRKSRERVDSAHSSREKRRSWSAFGPRESPSPIPSATSPRGRSSDRLTRKSPTSNLSSSKQLSSSVSNIYHRVKLVRLGPRSDEWFEMHISETCKKKPGSPSVAGPESGFADARSPVGALRSPVHHRSTPNLASFAPRDTKSTHSTPTHGPRTSAAAVTERLSRPKPGMRSPSTSTTNLSTPTSSAKRAPSPRTVGRPPSPRTRQPLSGRSSNASNASGESQTSGGSNTARRPPSPINVPRDKSSDSHSSGKTPSNKSTTSNPPPIKKALTPSPGVAKPTPTKPSQTTRSKPSTPAKKDSPTSATPEKPKASAAEKPKAPAGDKSKGPSSTPKASSTPAAALADKQEKPKSKDEKTNGSDNGDAKPELTAEERAKQALAERRRQARVQAEREAELEKQRQEQLKIEEEERKKKAEEERIRQEEEAVRLAEEHRIAEEQRLQREAEEYQRQMEEERVQKEEEERMKAEEERKKQEEIAKRQEELAKQEAELAAKHKREEEERDARRKRVDEIMKRARRGAQNKDDNSQPGSPDSEKSSDSTGEQKTNGISSSSVLTNEKYRHLLSGSRGIGSNPVSGDEDSNGDEGEDSDGAAKADISEAQNGVEETGLTAAELSGGGGGETNVVSHDNSQDANTWDGGITGGGDAVQDVVQDNKEEEERKQEDGKEDGPIIDTESRQEQKEEKLGEEVVVEEPSKVSAAAVEPASDAGQESVVAIVIDDAPIEQTAVEPSSKEMTVDERNDNGSLDGPSIPEIPNASEKTDSVENTNNGQMDQESSLVIDPKGSVESPLLIEHTASKTEIEITNGESGPTDHGDGQTGLEASLKVGVKLDQSPEDSGIEGNGQSGAVLTSEI